MKMVQTIRNDTSPVFEVGDEVKLRGYQGRVRVPPGSLCGVMEVLEENTCPGLYLYKLWEPAFGIELQVLGAHLKPANEDEGNENCLK